MKPPLSSNQPALYNAYNYRSEQVPYFPEGTLFNSFQPRLSCSSLPLSNIEEEDVSPQACGPPLGSLGLGLAPYSHLLQQQHPPETPQEPMDFLSRSWSISALEIAKAVNAPVIDSRKARPLFMPELGSCDHKHQQTQQHFKPDSASGQLVSAPLSFASAMTAQVVMDRIMARSDIYPFTSRRNSHSSGPIMLTGNGSASAPVATVGSSPPASPQHADELTTWLLLQQTVHPEFGAPIDTNKLCRSFSGMRAPLLRGMSMKKWLKEIREKKKEALRVHNAQVHAAMSVASVAAAVAAIAASTATANSSDDGQNKASLSVASAAALVAAHCVEAAESMGADRDHLSSLISSAVNVKTPGDVTTLTAAAATALRGAATLKARTLRNAHISHATVIPYDRSGSNSNFSGELTSEGSEVEFGNQDFLRRGCEFLKRTRKGELHWRLIIAYLNKSGQLIVKSQTKYMGGTFTKTKRRLVLDVITDLPAWPGRDLLDGGDQRRYFGLKTDHGVMELECKNETEHRLWTEGISRLLSLSQQHQRQLAK